MSMILERDNGGLYLIERAHVARPGTELAAEIADMWDIPSEASPFITWIAANFVESGKPNSNTQYWTADDLDKGEASIRFSPMNMVHKYRVPIGFFLDTRRVSTALSPDTDSASDLATDVAAQKPKVKEDFAIQVLGGMWSHIFPFETALVEKADDDGMLFTSMECRGTHLSCEGDGGCGKMFDYMAVDTHCEHLRNRTSIRHIVNPTFRGGALIVPPVRPGWKGASATILEDAVMQEAASLAEQYESESSAFSPDGGKLSAAGWERLMSMVVSAAQPQVNA